MALYVKTLNKTEIVQSSYKEIRKHLKQKKRGRKINQNRNLNRMKTSDYRNKLPPPFSSADICVTGPIYIFIYK